MSNQELFCLNPVLNPKVFLLGIAFFCLNGCTTPSEHFASTATDFKFNQQIIDTPIFKHQIFLNAAALRGKNLDTLHVYLDGDGTPWKNKRWIARDPTSRNSIILRLMRQDKAPAIFLGRPCYHGLNKSTGCHSRYWTSHRYSTLVVSSMAMAINQWLEQREFNKVTLIGYSGGGVLAILLAPEIPQLMTVVTLAANLDVAEWSRYHGYMPLYDSLNPADLEINSDIPQLHIAGVDDKVVPAYIIEKYANRQAEARFIMVPAQNHRCCWAKVWPELLKLF